MKSVSNTIVFLVFALGCTQAPLAQPASDTRGTTGLATLFARDPLTQSLCFIDGGPGLVFQEGQKRNRCSHLYFDSYAANSFSVGAEKSGVILDLGTPADLKAKYGFEETVGGGQGFASIDVKNGKVLILKDYKSRTTQELADSALLFQPAKNVMSVPVKLGHIYLIRITDDRDKNFEMFAKVLVVAHTPNESVTVRWYLMSNGTIAKL